MLASACAAVCSQRWHDVHVVVYHKLMRDTTQGQTVTYGELSVFILACALMLLIVHHIGFDSLHLICSAYFLYILQYIDIQIDSMHCV